MIRQVTWNNPAKLVCADCATLEERAVILCVNPEKVAPEFCPEQVTEQPWSYSTIEGFIIDAYRSEIINPPKWKYVFSYDDEQLIGGQTLKESDIDGAFCYSCRALWAEQVIGDEPYIIDEGDSSYIFVSQHGCEFPFTVSEDTSEGVTPALDFIFGDGPDGNLTVLTGESLVLSTDRNYYFNNLTINAGGELRLIGPTYGSHFQVFISGTLTVNGSLIADGQDAPAGSGQSQSPVDGCFSLAGGAPGFSQAAIITGDMNSFLDSTGPGGADSTGGCGGRGQSSTQSAQGGGQYDFNASWGAGVLIGGNGGSGGNGGGGASGGLAPDESTGEVFRWKEPRRVFSLNVYGTGGSYVIQGINGGAGGSGGGGGGRSGGNSAGGMGGGGGAGAGCLYVAARSIVLGGSGRISANGGNGGDGADGSLGTGTGAGGGGGGGAGGGGLVYLIYESLVNNGIIEAVGGTGGAGGAGAGSLANGDAGEDGEDGTIHLFNMTTGLFDTP